MSSYNKTKGKLFENQVADKIHEFFMTHDIEYRKLYESLDNPTLKPTRDFASGNFKNSDGDINLNLIKSRFPFSIECKFHKDLNLSINSIAKGEIKKLINIFNKQAYPKANENNLIPVVVFKANRTEIFILFKIIHLPINFLESFDFYVKIGNFAITLFDEFMLNYWKYQGGK